MAIFGVSSKNIEQGCDKVCAWVNQCADAIEQGIRKVEGALVKDTLHTKMSKAYNEGHKVAPQLVGKVCAVAMALVVVVLAVVPLSSAVQGGMLGCCLPWMSLKVALPLCTAIVAGVTAVFIGTYDLFNLPSVLGGLVGSFIGGVLEGTQYHKAVMLADLVTPNIGCLAVIGACVAIPLANVGAAIGYSNGKVIGRFTPIRHLCGAVAALATMIAHPFKG
jgi:hypothetical protein